MLWELSIVSSLSLYSILVQLACNDHAWLTSEYNHVTFTPIAKNFMLHFRLIYMLSILCVRLTIKVKVGIPESFKVGWYPLKKTGSSHLKSMITDRIGRQEVLLPINHNFNKICHIIGHFLNQNTRNSKFVLLAVKKNPFKRALDGAYCPIT